MWNLPYSNFWCGVCLLTKPKGLSDSSPSYHHTLFYKARLIPPCKVSVVCTCTPPLLSQVVVSLGQHYFAHIIPNSCNPFPAPFSGLGHSKSAFQLAHRACPWEDPHSYIYLYLPTAQVWKREFSAVPRKGSFLSGIY